MKETKRLVIDYWELNKQLPQVQTVQTKSKGMMELIPTCKMEHLLSRIKGAKYFSSIDLGQVIITFQLQKQTGINQLSHIF